jgi:hypothetical protein
MITTMLPQIHVIVTARLPPYQIAQPVPPTKATNGNTRSATDDADPRTPIGLTPSRTTSQLPLRQNPL